MKRIIIIILAGLLAVSLLAGCQTKTGGSATEPEMTSGTPPESQSGTEQGEPSENPAESAPPKFAKPEDFLAQKDIRLAVQAGTVGDWIAQDFVGADHVDQYAHYVDAITALMQDKVQGAIMDYGPALKIVKDKPELVIMEDALTEENYAFGIKKGNSDLLEAVNASLKKLSKEGKLQAIFDKYINEEEGAGDDIDFNKGAAGGQLIMGTESGFAPYELKKGDKIIGIDVEIMAEVAKSLDKELVIEDMNFDSLIAAVQSGKIDIIAAGLTVTDDRKKEIDFSDDYVIGAKQVLVVKAADLK